MDFKVSNYNLPDVVTFNFEELKTSLTERTNAFKNMVYSENDIKAAKSDRAELNRLKKQINDERIACEKKYMAPFEPFKKQCAEIISIIDESVKNVDEQVKAFENKAKAEKETQVRALFDEMNTFDWLKFEQIMDAKWFNASITMASITDDMAVTLTAITGNMQALKGLEYEFEATEVYKNTLSLAKAIEENKRLIDVANKKALIEVSPVGEPKDWMVLKVRIGEKDYDSLTAWLDNRGIDWSIE